MNKRAKPTSAQLAERTYRKMLSNEKRSKGNAEFLNEMRAQYDQLHENLHKNDCLTHRKLEALTDLVQILTDSHTGNYATLVDHCVRLLREKETLQKLVAALKMWSYPSSEMCGNKELHGPNRLCVACNTLFDDKGRPERVTLAKCAFEHMHRDGVICAVCNHNAPRRFSEEV